MNKHMKIFSYILVVSILLSLFQSTSFAGELKIKAIKNLSATVYINKSYSLPKVVTATMSNNTTQNVAITWDHKVALTSKIGTFVYKGIVKGYAKQVFLTLNVVALPKQPMTESTIAPVVKTSTIPEAITEPSQNSTYNDPELARAVELGIGAYSKNNNAVTFVQFFKMLDAAVALADSTKLNSWKSSLLDARLSDSTMTRFDGMMSVYYAAEALGEKYCNYNEDWMKIHTLIGDQWNRMVVNSLYFPGCNDPTTVGPAWNGKQPAAYFYSMGRSSLFSGATIFDFDPVSVSMRLDDSFKYEEALLAALRLYDSGLIPTPRTPTKEDETILSRADVRREAIRNSVTSVTANGKSYYVSNLGKDTNDGLSPETAWATLTKVNDGNLKPGDGVFFHRGDLWRGQQIIAKAGVSYSAYGAGDKPKFYMSPENGADPTKWKLMEGTNNIWIYHMDLQECGSIAFNDGAECAVKAMHAFAGGELKGPYNYDGGHLVMVTDHSKPFDLKASLNKDLMFYSADQASGFDMRVMTGTLPKKPVPLYLRCDKGNPGVVFKSIEFLSWGNLIVPADNTIYDNLCLKYTGSHAMFSSDNRITVENCEFGWVGGGVMCYDDQGNPVQFGNAVESDGSYDHFLVKNNYFYQIFDAAMTNQAPFSERPYLEENITYSGNLTEKCRYGIEFFFCVKDVKDHLMRNVMVDGNIFLHAGEGLCTQRLLEDSSASIMMWEYPEAPAENFVIQNNVFYLSTSVLLRAGSSQKYLPKLSGNTYVQNQNGLIARWPIPQTGIVRSYTISQYNAQEVLGDKTAIVIK